MKNYNLTIDSLLEKKQENINGWDMSSKKRHVIAPNSYERIEKKTVASSERTFCVEHLFDDCSLFIDTDASVILTQYGNDATYLDDVLAEFRYHETHPCAYVFGGNPGHMFNILQALHSYDIPVQGGYVDFFTGCDGATQEETEGWFGDLLRDFLAGVGGTALTINDLTGLSQYDESVSRKDIDVSVENHTIELYVTNRQYERIRTSPVQ